MDGNDKARLLLALVMVAITLSWAIFTVYITILATRLINVVDVVVAAGANGLLGVLATLTTLVYQFYFRKAPEKK